MSSSPAPSDRDAHAAATVRCPGSRGEGLDLDSYDSATRTAICPSCGQRVKLLNSGFFPKHLRRAES